MRLLLLLAVPLAAQTSLPDAVAGAVARYPSVRVSQQQLAAASAAIQLARTSYLPRLDGIAQINRATRNNVFGMLLPNSVIPPISGPVLSQHDLTSVWGSAVGILVSWEPFDFGLRQANVDITETSRRRAEAAVRRTQFEVAGLAADAYLTLLASEETVKAAQAAVDRARSIQQAIAAVVTAGLRPGVDQARAEAETAFAETQLIQARQAVDIARATLAQFTGTPVTTAALPVLPADHAPADPANHPRALEQSAAVDEIKAREKALDRSWVPRFNVQGATYARGSGARPDGSTGGAISGVGPNIYNWGLGLSVTFSVFDLPALRARKQIESHNESAEAARLDRIVADLKADVARAEAARTGARLVARNTPVQLRAARAAEQQATARYKSGLSSVVDVAEAQRLLTQAEIDDALARLNIWRAELAVAYASGNLDTFLASAAQ